MQQNKMFFLTKLRNNIFGEEMEHSGMCYCYFIPQLCGSLTLSTLLVLTVYSFSNDQLHLTIKTVNERHMFSPQKNVKYCDKLPRRTKCLVRASVVSTVPSTAIIVQRAVTNY
jgi:hypothetical protein